MKYELLPGPVPFSFNGSSHTLYRIKALEAFGDVKEGDTGGLVESTANLIGTGGCWLYDNAKAFGAAIVADDARLYENALAGGNAFVGDSAKMSGNSQAFGNARLFDCAKMAGNAKIYGEAWGYDYARLIDNAEAYGKARVRGNMRLYGDNKTFDNIWV